MRVVAIAALVLGAFTQGGAQLPVRQTQADDYTRYELLAPGSGKFRILYEVTATAPGATAFFNPIRKGSVASDERVIDVATGKALSFAIVPGAVRMTASAPGLDVTEWVNNIHLNLDPATSPLDLFFGNFTINSGTLLQPVISRGTDLFESGGGGMFDLQFQFSVSGGGFTRRFNQGESFSFDIQRGRVDGSTTAPAKTGPASGPRPTSSTPATRRAPLRHRTRS